MQVVDALNEEFSSFSLQMATIHRCIDFAYDISCITGNYLNAFVKVSAMALLSYLGG